MWVAEFKVWHKGSAAREVTNQFDVTLESHYLNVFMEKGTEYITGVMVVRGKDADAATAAFIDGITKQGVRQIKREGNQLFYIVPSVKQFHSSVLNANVFFIKPQFIQEGFAFWTVASFEKKHLMELYHSIGRLRKSTATIELLSLKQQPAPVFSSSHLHQLTEKQRQAFQSACREGYYACPRKISLQGLADKLGLAYTTFKDRLRSAEEKLWPALAP
ncbi:helix-turn-helix domain-containing protein [Candidatus Micrarchaeota archaeon]|nr:helix-turn-helix domain-containing protein [Candidatus Micrarchaeota archaeon]